MITGAGSGISKPGGRTRSASAQAPSLIDLKTFFTVIGKDPVEVTAADVLEFLADQRGTAA